MIKPVTFQAGGDAEVQEPAQLVGSKAMMIDPMFF
jgi:hypothetical protein